MSDTHLHQNDQNLANFNRFANFSAGPASLPTPVLMQAQQEMLDWQGKGVSVMEMSHRSAEFIGIAQQAEQDLRELLAVPDNYRVLFLQGGASLQFSAVPLNLLAGGVGDYLDTGAWSTKAIKEAKRYEGLGLGKVNVVASDKNNRYTSVPDTSSWQLTEGASYFHYCSNETIHGVQLPQVPKVDAPIVCDMSSNILSQPIDVSQYAMIYAGAQKNIGPAGLVIVIIREDMLGKASEWCPNILNYQVQADAASMNNTPATYSWYLSGLVFKWLKANGGVEGIYQQNKTKAAQLYAAIDGSDFYHNAVQADYRSIMNVPFLLADAKLDEQFLAQAQQAGLLNLKGHRSVGGMRASIYNAISLDWVNQLIEFMQHFEKSHA